MTMVPHLGFILAAYGLTAIVLGCTAVILVLDQRRQRQLLARLDRSAHPGDHG